MTQPTPARIEAKRIFEQYYKLLFLCESTKGIGIKCALNDVNNTLKEAPANVITMNRGGLSDHDFFEEVKTELEKL